MENLKPLPEFQDLKHMLSVLKLHEIARVVFEGVEETDFENRKKILGILAAEK